MTQTQQLAYLIHALDPRLALPDDPEARWRLFRSLVNIRQPLPVSEEFLRVQDALLQGMLPARGITDCSSLVPIRENLYLWQGDITTLRTDAIVNAANSQMLGCFSPCHGCIDNAIHTYAGVQLRLACAALMASQGHPEPTGRAKLTPAYNLPSQYILHTVGPIVANRPTEEDRTLLASCYHACLTLAAEKQLRSVAFCCISTGVFHFPNREAAEIAIASVTSFLRDHPDMSIVFNVFTDADFAIYQELLQ